MVYCGFVIEYSEDAGDGTFQTKFNGPHSTIQKAQEIYDSLLKNPVVRDARVCHLVCSPNNPKLY